MEEKILKRWLKRKIKITVALMIGFLITGGVMFGFDLPAENNEDVLKEYTYDDRPTTDQDWAIVPENITSFINNAKIVAAYTEINIKYDSTDKNNYRISKGNGIMISNKLLSLINSKEIKGYIYLEGQHEAKILSLKPSINAQYINNGNGISNENYENSNKNIDLGSITNKGMIVGDAILVGGTYTNDILKSSGNGIGLFSKESLINIRSLDNTGTIKGNVDIKGVISQEENSVYGDTEAEESGNGISLLTYKWNTNNYLGDIINRGIIKGNAMLRGGDIVEATKGVAAYAEGSGNGIGLYGFNCDNHMGNIDNEGTIRGEINLQGGNVKYGGNYLINSPLGGADAKAEGSGNGIGLCVDITSSNYIEDVKNRGIIKGDIILMAGRVEFGYPNVTAKAKAKSIESGNGIGLYSIGLINAMGDVYNTGIIAGNAILTAGKSNYESDFFPITGTYSNANAEADGSGNGIGHFAGYDYKSEIEDIVNLGTIAGNIFLKAGQATLIDTRGWTTSNASAMGIGNGNGIGITGGVNYESPGTAIGDIKNDGLLVGKAILIGGVATSLSVAESEDSHTSANVDSKGNGNGILNYIYQSLDNWDTNQIGIITSKGTISGYASAEPGKFNESYIDKEKTDDKIGYMELSHSGNGIAMNGTIKNNITNSGVIKGSQSAIAALGIKENMVLSNYGVMAGRKIYSDGKELKKNQSNSSVKSKSLGDLSFVDQTIQEKNLGIYVKLKDIFSEGNMTGGDFVGKDSDGDPIISNLTIGSGGTTNIVTPDGNQKDMQIINVYQGSKYNNESLSDIQDTYVHANNLSATENIILNGIGMKKGTLILNEDKILTNSILNGYNTALYVEDGKKFTGNSVIFNGGGLKSDVAVIRGGTGENLAGMNVTLKGNSITNGLVDMGSGENDILSLANTTQVNGDLDGGAGDTDILNLGDGGSGELRVLHDIRNFENIVSKGSTTLFETTQVTGLKNLEIKDGDLFLRIDPTVTKAVDDHEEVIGHALYSNEGNLTIKSSDGNLRVGLNGAGKGTIIHLGSGNVMDEKINSVYNEDDRLRTNNPILDAIIYDPGTNEKIIIDSEKYLPKPIPPTPDDGKDDGTDEENVVVPPTYDIMNDIYVSARSVDEEEKLSGDIDDHNQGVYEIYSILDQIYANNPYGYSLRAARDSMILFEDALSYFTIKPNLHEWIVQGKALYSHVEDKNDGMYGYKIRSNSAGGLASAEYGLTQDTSLGVVAGGLHSEADFRNSSKYKGDSFYASLYMKHDWNRFRFWTGAGYLYTSAKAERNIGNIFHSYSTKDSYDVNSMDFFGEVRYMPEPVDGWSLEPRAKLSFYYSSQDGADEGYDAKKFSIGTKKENQSTGRLELAGDIRKDFAVSSGEMKNRLSLGTGILLGKHRKDVTGYVLGAETNGTNFTIRGTEIPKVTGKVGYSLEYERTNGIIGTLSASYEFGGDYKNFETAVGFGYRF